MVKQWLADADLTAMSAASSYFASPVADYDQPKTAWVTIDNDLHQTGDVLKCIYSTNASQIGELITVEARNGKAVLVTVPAAGFVVFNKESVV